MNSGATDIAGSDKKYSPFKNYLISNSTEYVCSNDENKKRMERALTLPFVPKQ
ncbi:hypothetical protein [Peribacillus simplex]|uniref:hypothetical protein n=1 Tax=Peribacillus TaxID=2675229 RepID=UPI0036DF7972